MDAQPGSEIAWFDRQGQRLAPATAPGNYNSFCLTADQKRIVYDLADPVSANVDLWALDVGSENPVRLTFNRAVDFYAVCSPDSSEIAFASLREGPPNIFRLAIDSPGSEKAVLRSPFPRIPTDWSRDGRLLVYSVLSPKTNGDIHVVPIDGGEPVEIAATEAEERNGRLSPDGRWMAYISNESGGATRSVPAAVPVQRGEVAGLEGWWPAAAVASRRSGA